MHEKKSGRAKQIKQLKNIRTSKRTEVTVGQGICSPLKTFWNTISVYLSTLSDNAFSISAKA